jgi:DNA polymerase-3 subunit epsilon
MSDLGSTPFAVVDVETTGFSPRRGDRVVEIAVVRLEHGRPVEEYTTLVNPGRDVGPTHVHGISGSDVQSAPTFSEIAGDVARLIDGAVLVAHNLRFDREFLDAEFQRVTERWPAHPGVCTLDLAYSFDAGAASRKLEDCCDRHGIQLEAAHTALADARATAELFLAYCEAAVRQGRTTLAHLGCSPTTEPPLGWMDLRPTHHSWTRGLASAERREERAFLSRLVENLPGPGAPDAGTAAYLELLDRALEDRRVTKAEAEELMAIATRWALPRAAVVDAHRQYLADLVRLAKADGMVSTRERTDLDAVCELLGLPQATLEVLLAQPAPPRPAPPPNGSPSLAGLQVCFTGELGARIAGEPVTREQAQELARAAGLIVRSTVVKKLDLLVAVDPDSQSSKAVKARAQGTRILSEPAFWLALGVAVE